MVNDLVSGPEPALPVLLAAVLVASGAHLVVVGGTARHLRGDRWSPFDLDVVLDDRCGLAATVFALASLGADVPMGMQRRRSWSVETSLGQLDVVQVTSTSALPKAVVVDVAGVGVPVESRQ